ncbi:uncharacterized protein LOC136751350 isoform X2 [Amia ocellicauda]|uniref:uncharacterized protein LOC136751350 isoform X2 n=1 Tax=Amia ocellicauda TaxID=2972642 RepID=UPI003463DCDB
MGNCNSRKRHRRYKTGEGTDSDDQNNATRSRVSQLQTEKRMTLWKESRTKRTCFMLPSTTGIRGVVQQLWIPVMMLNTPQSSYHQS